MTTADTTTERVKAQQRLRLSRIGMSFISQMVTFSLVCFCAWTGLISLPVVLTNLSLVLLFNATFVILVLTNLNLRLGDPSMTTAQMLVALPPPLIVMFFIDEGQARATLLMIVIIPALYGMLALSTRQFILIAIAYVFQYLGLVAALWHWRPEVLHSSLEVFQILALALIMGEVALIGGFISGLRKKLRQRNHELHDMMERLAEMTRRDALTGLFNRRHLMEVLNQEANRCNRTDGPYSIAIFDIDHFKSINDTHGHQAGDLVLQRLAEAITSDLRNIDCFGRFGGEEFLLLLPQTRLEGAMTKTERLREKVAGLTFPEISDELRVTTSIGVTQNRKNESVDQALARADRALYQAKENGRDRICSKDG